MEFSSESTNHKSFAPHVDNFPLSTYQIGGVIPNNCEIATDLGVAIDSSLNFRLHIGRALHLTFTFAEFQTHGAGACYTWPALRLLS